MTTNSERQRQLASLRAEVRALAGDTDNDPVTQRIRAEMGSPEREAALRDALADLAMVNAGMPENSPFMRLLRAEGIAVPEKGGEET